MSRVCIIDYLKPKVHFLDISLFFHVLPPKKMHLAIKILPFLRFGTFLTLYQKKI